MSNNKTLAEKIVDSAGTGKADPVALALLSDITASATEINILDGVTATTAELNILDGVTATASEINKLDGVGAVVASGTQAAKINDPYGGATTDAEARTAINAIIDALEAFGISATWFATSALFQPGDILLWYDPSDLSTMFKDTAGTQPVTADDDSVALMLDKGQWGGKTLTQVLAAQTELVTNGGFDADASWTKGTSWTISGGTANAGGTGSVLSQVPTLVANTLYCVTYTVVSISSGNIKAQFQGGSAVAGALQTTAGTYTEFINSGNNTTFAMVSGGTAPNAVIDNVSVKEIPGYHRIQATGTSMPKYKTGPNPAAAENSPELVTNGTFNTDTTGWTAIGTDGGTDTTFSWNSSGYMDVTRGVGGITGRPSQGIQTVSGRAYRLSISTKTAQRGFFTLGTTEGGNNILSATTLNGNATDVRTFIASSSTTYISFWTDNSKTVVLDNISVKEIPASAPYIHWLLYDGTDDGHATGTITWGTDEVAVCAGITKSSDAAQGIVAELSVNTSANVGSFAIIAPGTNATGDYRWRVGGSTNVNNSSATSFSAPVTNVLTAIGDISGDSAILRADGAETINSSADQGTGNFGSYAMYFGRRGGTSAPFNGREYQTVIRSRLLSAAELSSLETFIAAKTGVTL